MILESLWAPDPLLEKYGEIPIIPIASFRAPHEWNEFDTLKHQLTSIIWLNIHCAIHRPQQNLQSALDLNLELNCPFRKPELLNRIVG